MDAPKFITRHHRPYFSLPEAETLSEKQRGKLSLNQDEKERQRACSLIEAVGTRMGFPRRTIATAQNLYHRLHLNMSRQQVKAKDACLAAIYVSAKMHDTLKKPRDILLVYYALQHPDKVVMASGEINVDPNVLEQGRQDLLAVERFILESLCFNFTSRMPFPYVIKIGRTFQASKSLVKLAWRLAVDAQRTLAPLVYPPHEIALASLYVASMLATHIPLLSQHDTSNESDMSNVTHTRPPPEIASMLARSGSWEAQFHATAADIDEAGHLILDVLIHLAQNPQSASTNTSPSTPTSPSPHVSRARAQAIRPSIASPTPYSPDQLMQLKILMREAKQSSKSDIGGQHHTHRTVQAASNGSEVTNEDGTRMLSRNDGTTRFLFRPEMIVPGEQHSMPEPTWD